MKLNDMSSASVEEERHMANHIQSVRYCLITANVVNSIEPALYFSRGQKHLYMQAMEEEDGGEAPVAADEGQQPQPQSDGAEGEHEVRLRATG